MRITTQVYVLVDGERKVIEHVTLEGTNRQLQVDIELYECRFCGALLYPTYEASELHSNWHKLIGN